MKPAWQIVTEALDAGYEVKIRDTTWVMVTGFCLPSENPSKVSPDRKMLMVKMLNSKGEPHYVNPDITFNGFLWMCEQLTQSELFEIGFASALTQHKRRKRA